jgi:D-lyxose ketol-isomerase
MKRSEVNKIITNVAAFFKKHRFMLTEFASWTLETERMKNPSACS